MKTYRYALGKQYGYCPQCHHRRFKYYIDVTTGEILDERCGRCNREVNCGYHAAPKQFITPQHKSPFLQTPPPPQQTSFFDKQILLNTPEIDMRDDLFAFITTLFDYTETIKCFLSYHVRHAAFRNGSTAFWLVDAMNRIRSAKVMAFDRTSGHRIKDPAKPSISYAHALMGLKNFNYQACFFGEQLAGIYRDRELLIVESEKTALLLDLWLTLNGDTSAIVLATGGANAIRPVDYRMTDPDYRCSILNNRRVTLIPDADMVDQWAQYADMLKPFTQSIRTIDVKSEFGLEGSQDIGDWIINQRKQSHLTTAA